MNFLELLENRYNGYKKTWQKISLRDKIIFITLIVVGVAQIAIGAALCARSF